MNKKCIKIIFIFFVFIYFFMFISNSFATYGGDDTYTDANNTIFSAYESICNDFVTRMQFSNSSLKDTIFSSLSSSQFNCYLFYGQSNGLQMIGSSPYNTQSLYCYIYSTGNAQVNLSQYNDYQGISTNVFRVSSSGYLYLFSGNDIFEGVLGSIYIPAPLFNYRSESVKNYLTNTQSSQTNSIISAIESTSSETQNTISQSAQETQNVITNSTVNDNTMVIDTDDMEIEDTEGVYDFFTSFLDTMKNTFTGVDGSVSVIQIPLPFVDGIIELHSDVISSVISGTYLATLVELFWYFVFGTYYIIFVKRMLDWLSTGQIAQSGITGFIKYLDGQNQIIKTYMM